MSKYYVKVAGRKFGPLASEKIAQMVKENKITRETELSTDGTSWRRAGDIAEFFPSRNAGQSVASSILEEDRTWFVTTDGTDRFGPTTAKQIVAALESGRLTTTARAWRQGESARPVDEIPEFQPSPTRVVEKKEWYYSADGKNGLGPYTESEILSFVEQGRANYDSLVWRQGENASRPMRSEPVFLKSRHDQSDVSLATSKSFVPVVTASPSQETPYAKRNRRLNQSFALTWICFGVSFAFGVGCAVVKIIAENSSGDFWTLSALSTTALFLGGIATTTCAVASSSFFTYYFWQSVPEKFARTTPGVATSFLFAPFVNFYWSFVTFRGGTKDLIEAQRHYAQSGMNRGERPENLGALGATCLSGLTTALLVFLALFSCVYAALFYDVAEVLPRLLSGMEILDAGEALPVVYLLATVCFFLFGVLYFLNLTVFLYSTSLWSALSTLSLGLLFDANGSTEVFLSVFSLFFSLLFALYPLFFVLCMWKARRAATQMNNWQERGASRPEVVDASGPRVTLDDVLNS